MRALLIWNPVAGRRPQDRRHRVEAAARTLGRHGWKVELASTDEHSGARSAARQAIDAGFDVLIACGGDGTLGQTAAELAGQRHRESVPRLALLPGGTANVFARHLGLELDVVTAARRLTRARPARVPVGLARWENRNTGFFVAFASAGFDAHVVHSVSPSLKKAMGKTAFVLTAMREMVRYGFKDMRVEITHGDNTRELTADQIIWGFTRYYAGGFRFGPARERSEPCLLAFRWARSLLMLHSTALMTGALHRAPGVRHLQANEVNILTAGVPVQLDGEAAGFTPVRLSILPDAIELLVP